MNLFKLVSIITKRILKCMNDQLAAFAPSKSVPLGIDKKHLKIVMQS